MLRLDRLILGVTVALGACGGTAPAVKSVTVVPATVASSRATTVAPHLDPTTLTLVPAYEAKVSGVHGIALEGTELFVNVAGAARAFDAHGPVAPRASPWKPGDPLVVVGDDAFDPASLASHAPKVAPGLVCESHAFSYAGVRMSANCRDATGETSVYVYDTRTGASVGVFKDFHTAAPIRSGAVTASGNFVFWVARASGAYEEIKSHVTGPLMSSRSVMSRDETMVFTTLNREWYSEDKSKAKVIDPKNAHVLFELPSEVDLVFFSPSSRLFVARHSKNWGDMMHGSPHDTTWMTVHGRGAAELARVPDKAGDEPREAAFAPDDSALAVRFASGSISVYTIAR